MTTTSYKYEFNGKCIASCPENTLEKNYTCIPCNSSCKTCETDINICTSCYENKYLYKGSCISNCVNGFYQDKTDSSINRCKCQEQVKCKECSSESLSHNNLCISCNDNYHPILNDDTNFENFINCYTGNKVG